MEAIISAAVPFICLLLFIYIITKPIRFIFKLVLNTAMGFLCLLLLNHFGDVTGIVFNINFMTAAIAGVLGVPGILLLLVMQFFM